MAFRLHCRGRVRNCEVALTASKSISNRALIIRSLCDSPFQIENLSTSTDTQNLKVILERNSDHIDVIDAGTAFRFMVSFLSIKPGKFFLTGSERMKLRPIGPLVDSLRSLGASLDYRGDTGFPPLEITGKKLSGGEVSIDRSLSSQFVSSLLLISPLFENGLNVELTGTASSESYLNMTLKLMKYFGIEFKRTGEQITVLPQKYSSRNINIENDWSAASYWYSLCALNSGSEFILQGLEEQSIQGDRIIVDIMKLFGVSSKFENDKVVISSEHFKNDKDHSLFEFDFASNPDLMMTVAVLCAAKGIHGTFTGVSTLRIKESDRLLALKSELEKCGVKVVVSADTLKVIPSGKFIRPELINTHNDHRIAMSFAPLVSILDSISFDNIDVVSKSYPEFWSQLSNAGLMFSDD